MQKTSIEWVRNPDGSPGYTFNPITGCLNGCEYCYARKLANGRLKSRYLANNNLAPTIGEGTTPLHTSRLIDALDPFYPRFWNERLYNFPRYGKSKGIFVCDMGELFGDWIPAWWQNAIFSEIKECHWHRFYLLTKQPQNLIKWSPFPGNCYVGVTATDQWYYSKAIKALRNVKASVKYLSIEPLLSRIDPSPVALRDVAGIGQVIIGAQTKPYKPPKIEWVEEIVRACDNVGTPVFLKDNLKPLIDKHYPDESQLVPNHNELVRMKHPTLCINCEGESCSQCGVIWGLRQEMPKIL